MPKTYEPDCLFVDRLEWQLASEYRRLNRLKPAGKIAIPRTIAMVTAMVGILLTGVAAIKAADYIKDSWRKKIELARAETEVALKKSRLEYMSELAADTETRLSKGLVQEEDYAALKLGVEKAGRDLDRSVLNLDEVKASGTPPRDELYAPLVEDRDFVSERLRIEVKDVEADLELLANRRKQVQELVGKAVDAENELGWVQAEIDARKATIAGILKRLDLRKRFLNGEVTALEVDILDRMAVAKGNLSQAQAKVDFLKKELERLQTLEASGMISGTETGQLRYGLEAAQTELKLIAIEIHILEKAK